MNFFKLAVLALTLFLFAESKSLKTQTFKLRPNTKAVDLTLISGSFGEDVVNACVLKIESIGVFANDFGLMRRIARVETNFGNDYSSSANQSRGIWQIPSSVEAMLQDPANQALLSSQIASINSAFGGSLLDFNNMDFTVPFQSIIALRLYMESLGASNLPGSLNEQATWWTTNYNTIGVSVDFEFTITSYEATLTCSDTQMDLWFCLDRSGSIAESDFNTSLQFVKEVSSRFVISPNGVRTGFSIYNGNPQTISYFNEHTNNSEFIARVDAHPVETGGSTSTGRAITDAVNNGFSVVNGVRPPSQVVPRILVVVTDGKSQDEVLDPADNARAAGITVYAVGVGSGFVESEIHEIASEPVSQYASSLTDFDALINILTQQIAQESCTASAVVPINITVNISIQPGNDHFSTVEAPAVGFLSLSFSVTSTTSGSTGQVYLGTVQQPSLALNFFSFTLLPASSFQVSIDLSVAVRSKVTNESDSNFKRNFGARQQTNPLYMRIASTGSDDLLVTYAAATDVIFTPPTEAPGSAPENPTVIVVGLPYSITSVNSLAIIAGSIAGGIVGLALIIAIVYIIRRKQESQKVSINASPVALMEASNVIIETPLAPPAVSEFNSAPPAVSEFNSDLPEDVKNNLDLIPLTLSSGSAFDMDFLRTMEEAINNARDHYFSQEKLLEAQKNLMLLRDRLDDVKNLKDDLKAFLISGDVNGVIPLLKIAESLNYIGTWRSGDQELVLLFNQARMIVHDDQRLVEKREAARQKLQLDLDNEVESHVLERSMIGFEALLPNLHIRNDADITLLKTARNKLYNIPKERLQNGLRQACETKVVKDLKEAVREIETAMNDSRFARHIEEDEIFWVEIAQGKILLDKLQELRERKLAVLNSHRPVNSETVSSPPELVNPEMMGTFLAPGENEGQLKSQSKKKKKKKKKSKTTAEEKYERNMDSNNPNGFLKLAEDPSVETNPAAPIAVNPDLMDLNPAQEHTTPASSSRKERSTKGDKQQREKNRTTSRGERTRPGEVYDADNGVFELGETEPDMIGKNLSW